MKEIIYYKTINGKCPYLEWYNSLNKIKFVEGAGYRIYAYECEEAIIVFLSAGDKSKQSKDIDNAKKYLQEFKERYK